MTLTLSTINLGNTITFGTPHHHVTKGFENRLNLGMSSRSDFNHEFLILRLFHDLFLRNSEDSAFTVSTISEHLTKGGTKGGTIFLLEIFAEILN
jgi:hypothetical protein